MYALYSTIPPHIFDIIGVAGFALYVVAYGLLTINVLKAEHLSYFALNWLAATFVLIGLTSSFNLASALIQVFWIVVSTLGIVIRLRKRRNPTFASIRSQGFTPT